MIIFKNIPFVYCTEGTCHAVPSVPLFYLWVLVWCVLFVYVRVPFIIMQYYWFSHRDISCFCTFITAYLKTRLISGGQIPLLLCVIYWKNDLKNTPLFLAPTNVLQFLCILLFFFRRNSSCNLKTVMLLFLFFKALLESSLLRSKIPKTNSPNFYKFIKIASTPPCFSKTFHFHEIGTFK